jgi:hypothetical protein
LNKASIRFYQIFDKLQLNHLKKIAYFDLSSPEPLIVKKQLCRTLTDTWDQELLLEQKQAISHLLIII